MAFGEYADDEISSTMQARDYKDVTDLIVTPPPARAVALRGREGGRSIEMGGDVANALRASSGGSDKEHVLAPGGSGATMDVPGMIVRRLMPVECERLQGLPDGWTEVPVGGKLAADGPRYKQLGNSWAFNCVRWYGHRIDAHLAEIERPAIEARPVEDDGLLVWITAP